MIDQVTAIVIEFSDLIIGLVAISVALTIADWFLDRVTDIAPEDDRSRMSERRR